MMEKLYSIVEDQYFESGDFNGMPLYRLIEHFDIESEELLKNLRKAIEDEILTARFHDNTHIIAFSGYPTSKILEWFDSGDHHPNICFYPHSKMLLKSDRINNYRDSPYKLELAKGSGQLDFRAFDLSVLEHYRNDPRYAYETDCIHGSIYIEDEYFESENMPESDQVFLKTFGFSYDINVNRYVAVFLRYLSGLSSEHQHVWAAKEFKGGTELHPDYFASSILGSWGTRISIFEAFVQELKTINEMSEIIGKPSLFNNCYSDDRPKEFSFLLRPTESEFNSFIHLLDKMLSDNINKKFFEKDVDLEMDEERADGKIVVRQKGTIQILESWLNKFFKPADRTPIDEMIQTFKDIRKLRQKPAHKINNNSFDQKFFHQQRETVIRAYEAVRTLRLILANHPRVEVNPPDIGEHLLKGEIWDI